MSIILALLLLFLALHSCNARVLGVAHVDYAKEEFQHSITKENDENLNGVVIRHVLSEVEKENSVGEAEKEKSVNVGGDSSASKKTLKVSHKNKGEEEAGFDLDYLPPRTHPPSHN